MKRYSTLLIATIVFAFVGCGSSRTLTDTEKKTALAAIGSFSQTSRATIRNLVDAQRRSESCTPSESTSEGASVKIECPTAGTSKVTISAAGPLTRKCGAESFTAKDLLAVITIATSDSSLALSVDLGVTANDKKIDCDFNATSNSSTGVVEYSASGFSCTYDGGAVSAEDLKTINCGSR